ncbi:MAG: SpoIIE family protein phosphatase [Clostridia bacterium]|nr:SpoIIE family protein phosphatase [Clostridia bacterium]
MFKKYFNSLNTNKKILVFVLFSAFLAQIFTGILACASILKCSYSVNTEGDKLAKRAEDSAKIALQNQSKDILLKMSSQVSDSADLFLTQTEGKVENLCDFSENAYVCSSESTGSGNQMKGYVINSSENSENADEVLIYENNKLPENLEKEFKILSSVSGTAGTIYKSSEEIAGVYIASESGVVYKSGSEASSGISDPRKSDWYKKAKDSAKNGQKTGVWSLYNLSSEGYKPHIIFSKAFFDASKRISGVVAIDLYADKVCNKISASSNYDDKYVFIFDNDVSKVISSHSDSDEFFKGFDNPSESYNNLILSLKNREYGVCNVLLGEEEYLTAFAPIKKLNWTVGITEKPLTVATESRDIKETLLGEMENSKKKSGSDTSAILFQFFIIFCSFGIVMYAFCTGTSKKILPDMDAMENDAKEFRKLKAELEMAEKVQKSMMPETTPTNLKRDDMEIYASSVPAEKVGGDFYDFFFIDDNRIALVIADAADKGVPAALYMSAAKNLIKNKLKSTGSLAVSLESVNDSLYEDNDMRMFVTAFVGIFNIKSRRFEFINAGHTPPLFYNHGKGSYDFLSGPHNSALGGIKGKKYATGEITIYKDDVLLLYTDGITETMNSERKLFSQDKLKELVNSENLKNLPVENLIEAVRTEVKNYSGKGGYSDDITLLGFRNLTD